MEPCSPTVSPLHGIVSSWSHNLCAVHPSEIFTLAETSSYATNRIISDKLRSDWKTRKVVGTHAKGCARFLAEEWKVVASVVEWLMPGKWNPEWLRCGRLYCSRWSTHEFQSWSLPMCDFGISWRLFEGPPKPRQTKYFSRKDLRLW